VFVALAEHGEKIGALAITEPDEIMREILGRMRT
jgi:hypothetical protein